ncbi:unnamed protein product [Cunninghamella blakesleeana]
MIKKRFLRWHFILYNQTFFIFIIPFPPLSYLILMFKKIAKLGEGLQAAAGFQFLISNHHQILENMIHKACELPLEELLESHQTNIKESQQNYDIALDTISKKIRSTEAINLQQAKKGQRDLFQYKRTLQDLNRQVNELDHIKEGYQNHMLQVEREQHQHLLNQTGWLVRAQVDLYEFLSSKGLGDSQLEQLIQQHPDPFCAYDSPSERSPNELFTVLPTTKSLIDPLPFDYHINQKENDHHNIYNYQHLEEENEDEDYDQEEENDDDDHDDELNHQYKQRLIEKQRQENNIYPPFIYTKPSNESFHEQSQHHLTSPSIKSSSSDTEKKDEITKEKKRNQQDNIKSSKNNTKYRSNISQSSSSDSGLSRNGDWNDEHRKETSVGI